MSDVRRIRNGEAVALGEVPLLPVRRFGQIVADAVAAGARVPALFGRRDAAGELVVTAVLADDPEHALGLLSTLAPARWPSLAAECPALAGFERELAEQFGLALDGHPWAKPLRCEPRLDRPVERGAAAPIERDGPFFEVKGEAVHEVAVGPVHAGIIEPGHFRFQCHGEHVFHLEIALGYQHRGVERLLAGPRTARTLAVVESIAGDTTVGHALAHAGAVEALGGVAPPERAEALRAVALELERLANHTGDLGALANDVGFLPSASYLGALRAEFLNTTAELCGNRMGRGLVVPGGVRFDPAPAEAERLAAKVEAAAAAVRRSADLFFQSPSVRNRTDGTGTVSADAARALGLVGPAARASGLERDVRRDHPHGAWRRAQLPIATAGTGDVYARARVRDLEIERSAAFAVALLRALPAGPVRGAAPVARPGAIAVSLVEGWRGELAHVAISDGDGGFARYKVTDPSFHDWPGLALALRGEGISDFPLCNKSFNLSYAGHDL